MFRAIKYSHCFDALSHINGTAWTAAISTCNIVAFGCFSKYQTFCGLEMSFLLYFGEAMKSLGSKVITIISVAKIILLHYFVIFKQW